MNYDIFSELDAAEKRLAERVLAKLVQRDGPGAWAELDAVEGDIHPTAVALLRCEIQQQQGTLVANDETLAALTKGGPLCGFNLRACELLLELWRRDLTLDLLRATTAQEGINRPELLHWAATLFLQLHFVDQAPEEALNLFTRALALQPDNTAIQFDLAKCLFFLNKVDEAESAIGQVIEKAPWSGVAHQVRSGLRTVSPERNHVALIRQALAIPRLPPNELICGFYALGKEEEDIGHFPEAFQAYAEGARVMRAQLDYSVNQDVADLRHMRDQFDAEMLGQIPDSNCTFAPVFIVGLPRTGTTLLERLLTEDAGLQAVGERIDFPTHLRNVATAHSQASKRSPASLYETAAQMDFSELGHRYQSSVSQLLRTGATPVDKLPWNFRYCGLLLKAMPNAKIIHMTREPMDTCFSVFKTLFQNAYHFSYDLDELGEYYCGYRDLMDHWSSVLGPKMLTLEYEALVADPTAQAQRLYAFCELEWNPDVLDFYKSTRACRTASSAQIRRPIYRDSISKWRCFEDDLGPLYAKLSARGRVV